MTKTIYGRMACFALTFIGAFSTPAVAGDSLRLRLHDATALPGGIAAVVVRTYASRPIRQGQICFVSRPLLRAGVAAGPFETLESATVFSAADDASEFSSFIPGGPVQTTMLEFASASATINANDGPLLVLRYRVRADVMPGETYALDIDLDNTFLSDASGTTVELEGRGSELRIRAPGTPVRIAAASEEPEFGRVMLSLQTDEALSISSGQFGLRYPGDVVRGGAKVFVDPRYGNAQWHLSAPRGLLVISLRSQDHSLGSVPGDIVGIMMRMQPAAELSTDRRIWIDPAYTFLYDQHGATLPLSYEDDWIPQAGRKRNQIAMPARNSAAISNP